MSVGGVPHAGQADSVCPVCWWPIHDAPTCDRCGWERPGQDVAVPVPADDERYLLASQLHDLRAAMRVAGPMASGNRARFDRLAVYARGGPPSAGQLERIVADIEIGEPTVAGTRFALTRLIAGEVDAIAFIEIGPDALAMDTLLIDEPGLGVPVRSGGESIQWTSVLPLLPDDADLRHFRLAGGIGAGLDQAEGPAILAAAVSETVEHVLARLTAGAAAAASHRRGHRAGGLRVDTILVRRTHQWPLLEEAASRARAIIRPVADIFMRPDAGALAEVVDSVIQGAPLRYGYYLILAAVDQADGDVTATASRLFASGTAPAPDAPLSVRRIVRPPKHAAERLALPIVARRDADEERWPPPLVQIAAIDGTSTRTTELTVQLEAPGRVSVWGTPPLVSADGLTADWPQPLTNLPGRIHPAVVLDLVLLVELGGDEDTVSERVGLARDLVGAVDDGADVHVAVVGYRDHFGRHHHLGKDATGTARERESRSLLVGCGLTDPLTVRRVLAEPEKWQAVPVRDYHASPIEDALFLVAGNDWAWRPETRHVLAIIGDRPPHPARIGPRGGLAVPCPRRYSWQDSLGQLRQSDDITCIAVSTGRARLDEAWRSFLRQGGFIDVRPEPDRLARAVGLPEGNGPVQLRLAASAESTPVRPTRREVSR
jgi:hypothetical protein